MNTRLSVLGLAALLLLSACPEPQPVVPPVAPPAILSFTADRVRVQPGDAVTLSFETRDADAVVLLDEAGQQVETSGDVTAGEAVVHPTKTRVYLLKATSAGGRASAFVQISVGEDLAQVSLVAIPPKIDAGQAVDLVWTAFHAKEVQLKTASGEAVVFDPAVGSGIVSLTPSFTTSYTLTAFGASPERVLSASTTVKVAPVVRGFDLAPNSARAGGVLTLAWSTLGASRVALEERTFGMLLETTEAAQVEEGTLSWTVPEHLPSGAPTLDGTPLLFTLTVGQSDPELTLTRTLSGYVGEGLELDFEVPGAVTAGRPLQVAWTTRNAVRVQVKVDGLTVYEPRAGNAAAVADGEFAIRDLKENVVVELVAHDYVGGFRTLRQDVTVVNPPAITSFNAATPIASSTAGSAVQWTTSDATAVTIRAARGPVLFFTAQPAAVSAGQATIYTGQRTMLVLEAWNAAGERVEERQIVEVAASAEVSASPTPLIAGSQVTVSWNLDPSTTAGFVGLPDAAPLVSHAGNEFIDLANQPSRVLKFSDPDEAVARLRLALPFRFPFLGAVQETFFVSTNGFLTFARTEPHPANQDLASTSLALPGVIAPLWEDLALGAGEVLYAVVGNQFPRILVVQWNKVSNKQEGSELTFQLQLEESGELRFVYQTLSGPAAGGENATIGVRHGAETFAATYSRNPGSAGIASGQSLTWFGSGALSGNYSLRTERSSQYAFFTRTQLGRYVLHAVQVEAFGPQTVNVSEAMPLPATGLPEGRWIELVNRTDQELNLEGLELSTGTAAQPLVLPELVIPAGGHLVLGQSADPADSDGAGVEFVYQDLPLEPSDTVELTLSGQVLSSLSWSGATAGKSVVAPERAIDTLGGKIVCPRSLTFGAISVGSPGVENEVCFPYALQSIPGAFEDISATGFALPTSPAYGSIELEVPFVYFGQSYETVRYSQTGGFLSFGAPLTATSTTNKEKPGTAAPRGTVAPFWDILVRNTTGNQFVRRRADHTIVSWQDFRVSSGTNGVLNFQAKLFDSGVIEFHFGPMVASTVAAYLERHTGESATTWIERPDGSAALPVNINTAGAIHPHSGYRFIPVQQ